MLPMAEGKSVPLTVKPRVSEVDGGGREALTHRTLTDTYEIPL